MSLADYGADMDFFEFEDQGVFSFPCCVCKHKDLRMTEHPCVHCGHNCCSEDMEVPRG